MLDEHTHVLVELRRELEAAGRPGVELVAVSATEARNEFATFLEKAIARAVVVIHKQDTPKAVLLSLEALRSLLSRPVLNTLTAEWDALLAKMQTPKARAGMMAAWNATPEEIGRAAVRAARAQKRNNQRKKKGRG